MAIQFIFQRLLFHHHCFLLYFRAASHFQIKHLPYIILAVISYSLVSYIYCRPSCSLDTQQICFGELCAFSEPNYVTKMFFPPLSLCSLGEKTSHPRQRHITEPQEPLFQGKGGVIFSRETAEGGQISFEIPRVQNTWKAS